MMIDHGFLVGASSCDRGCFRVPRCDVRELFWFRFFSRILLTAMTCLGRAEAEELHVQALKVEQDLEEEVAQLSLALVWVVCDCQFLSLCLIKNI